MSRSSSSSSATAPRRLVWPVLAILLMIAVMVATVWWRVLRPQQTTLQAASAPQAAAAAAAGRTPDLARMGQRQLLSAARSAMHAQRLVAPAGDNAVAYYLQVLHKDPRNRVAGDALREVFPFAAQAVEQTINAGALDQAQRELDLLARVDPANYTLTLLRSKLADRRRLAAHETAQADAARPAAPASGTPSEPAPTARQVASADPQPGSASAHHPAPASAPAGSRAKPGVVTAPEPAKVAKVQRTAPLLLRQVRPYYPAAARRQHRQGWVEVSYTVAVDGHVDDAHVVRAQPLHLFDHAALSAVGHWLFQPARINGKPVPAVLTSRVNFTLPQ